MRALILAALVALSMGAAFGGEKAAGRRSGKGAGSAAGMQKGSDTFSGKIRGTVKVDGGAVWIEQVNGAPLRVATDNASSWSPLNDAHIVADGDFVVFNGTPTVLVKRAAVRTRGAAADKANLEVRGRVKLEGSGGVTVETRDGMVRVANPDIAEKMRALGAGARVRVNGSLAADGGAMVLNATNWRELKAGTGRARQGKKGGKVESVAKAESPSGDAKSDAAQPAKKFTRKHKKSGEKASEQWDAADTKNARKSGKTAKTDAGATGAAQDGGGWMTPYDPEASDAAAGY